MSMTFPKMDDISYSKHKREALYTLPLSGWNTCETSQEISLISEQLHPRTYLGHNENVLRQIGKRIELGKYVAHSRNGQEHKGKRNSSRIELVRLIGAMYNSMLSLPHQGTLSVENVLSRLEQGNIQEASFRCFLDDLESTSLRDYASLICDKLFLVVERNLTLSEEQAAEVAALGCVVRKLVFNLTDEGIPRIVNLLNNAEKKRGEHNATSVEMLMYKSLVDRFEFRPIFRNKGIKPIADRCYQTISQFGQAIDSKAERTQVVLIDALLGFACYATEDQIAECSLNIYLPGHLGRFLSFMGGKIQNAIAQKISEQSLRRDILSFIKDLKNENNLS